jgi:long-chain acyl-CoA synthetase
VVLAAVRTGHTDVARVAKDLPTFKPTFVLAVPRVFERIYDSAQRKAAAGGKERIFTKATETAIAYSQALEHGRPRLRLSLLRGSSTGSSTARSSRRSVVSCSGASRAVQHSDLAWVTSFRGIGVTVLEGYGLTETTAAATVNTRAGTRMGTVGRALPGFESVRQTTARC